MVATSTLAACASTTKKAATSTTLGPLQAPRTNTVQDTQYLADVTQANGDLARYVQTYGNVALQALLTDGSAFCAFLHRSRSIDDAMTSLAIGTRSNEAQTHLPSTVATYNTIDAVALLTLCPSEQRLLPAADQQRVQQLAKQLGAQPG